MFFGLTNSPATFQVMINDLLRDLVVEEKMVVFIDDVMVATEMEEVSRSLTVDFIFSFHFILFFFSFIFLLFYFLFLEQLGSISHSVTSVTN